MRDRLDTATPAAPPVRTPSRLFGPCGHGPGPCGATLTRPYACGARCVACTPTAFEAAGGCPCTTVGPWRVLATGSRRHRDKTLIWSACDGIHAHHPDMLVVHGACYPRANARGERPEVSADWLVHLWCVARGVPDEPHPADWDAHGDDAGKLRNAEMVALGADECIGFPLGRSPGTWDCMRKAKAAGIPVAPVPLEVRERAPSLSATGQDSLFEVVA